MDVISWGCECVVHWSKAIENNSGQIQIVIAICAIGLAWKGYEGVLTQIKMAKDQSEESAEQTKHFADQVKEVAKQTQYAAQQLENSNKQVDTLIEHRDLILNIRDGELKGEYIKICVEAIELLQNAEALLEKTKKALQLKMKNIKYDKDAESVTLLNITHIDIDLKDFAENIKRLINISTSLVNGDDVNIKTMQENIYTINIMKLRALRSSYIYPKFNNELSRQIK